MKRSKKTLVLVLSSILILALGTTALAASVNSPAQIYAALKGISVDEAYELRQAGTSFGKLAANEGLLEEFRALMLENKIAGIEARVQEGKLSEEEAKAIITTIEERMQSCDGTASGRNECLSLGFGSGNKMQSRSGECENNYQTGQKIRGGNSGQSQGKMNRRAG